MDTPPEPLRILVVEDEQVAREALARFLELEGHSVATAGDGAAALTALSAFSPDIVITDLSMPVMDGLTLARRIRALPNASRIGVLLMSANDPQETRMAACTAVVNRALSKPFSFDELLAGIAEVRTQVRRDLGRASEGGSELDPEEEHLLAQCEQRARQLTGDPSTTVIAKRASTSPTRDDAEEFYALVVAEVGGRGESFVAGHRCWGDTRKRALERLLSDLELWCRLRSHEAEALDPGA